MVPPMSQHMIRPVFGQAASAQADDDLGTMPVWDLDDLYPGMESEKLMDDLIRHINAAEANEAA